MQLDLTRPNIKRLLIERMRVTVGAEVPARMLQNSDLVEWQNDIAGCLAYQLQTFVAAHTKTETTERETGAVKVPETWWDHVKEHFAPQWLLNRWPVKYTKYVVTIVQTTTTTNVCPYIDPPKDARGYIEFLEYGPAKF